MKKAIVCLAALMVFSGGVSYAESINVEKLNFELGIKSLNQHKLDDAIKYFKLVLDKNPDNVEANYNIAVAYKKLGNNVESLKYFNKVVELLNEPTNNTGNIFRASKFSQSRKQAVDSARSYEDDVDFDVYTEVKAKENDYIDLGDMHSDNEQFESAIEYYNLALQVNPYNGNTYYKICKCYLELGDYLNAEPYIKRAVELDPTNSRYTYYQKKIANAIYDKFGDEVVKREKIVFQNLNEEGAYEKFKKKNYKKELYQGEWVDVNADSGATLANKDFMSAQSSKLSDNQREKIQEYYQDKNKRRNLHELSQSGYENASYRQSQELDYLDLGDLHYDNGEYETAMEYYNSAIEINPNNDYTYYKLSKCALALGQKDKASFYINKAIALSGKSREYVFFKNKLDSGIAETAIRQEDEFYQPPRIESPYVDDIAFEQGREAITYPKFSLADRIKSSFSWVKLPGTPKLAGKLPNPLEGKVERYSKRRIDELEERRKYAKQQDEIYFKRPLYDPDVLRSDRRYPDYGLGPEPKTPSSPYRQAEAEAYSPYSPDEYNRKGVQAFKENDLAKAEEYFKKAIELKPMFPRGYNNLANVEFQRGNLAKAKEYALKSVEIDPNFTEGYYNLSTISKKEGKLDEEIRYLDKAIQSNPRYFDAYFARGLAYYKKGNYEKAKYDFGEVLRFKNNNFAAAQNLGIIYANELNYEQAEKYLTQALQLDNNNSKTYFHLGVVRKNAGKYSSAIEDFKRAVELNPSDYRAYVALSQSYDRNSQPELAIDILKRAAERNAENAEVYNYLGLLNLKFEKYEEARAAFKKATEKDPNRPIYHYNLSQCYLCMGQRKESNFEFQRAINIVPSSIQDYTDLASIFLDRGMATYSIEVLKEGISRLTRNDYLFLVLSDFYEKTGAIKSASDVLREYLAKKKDNGTFNLLVRKKLAELERDL